MKALGRSTAPSPTASSSYFAAFSAESVPSGLYAAVRPRFGPGLKTAVLTGFAFWLITTVLWSIDDAGMSYPFLYPPRLLAILIVVCLCSLLRHPWPEPGFTRNS